MHGWSVMRFPVFCAAAVLLLAAAQGCSPSTQESGGEEPMAEGNESFSGQMVSFPSGQDTISAYLARPASEPEAIVVVIHEWWGLNDWVKEVADRLAGEGHLAIAPDLYRGQVATEAEEAHELSRGLPEERAVGDVRAAAAHVRAMSGLGGLRVGVIGFCMGGRLSLISSLDDSPFAATVVCYGRPETSVDRLATLRGPVLGIYGADDKGIGPEQVDALDRALEAAGKQHEILVMDHAGHAFLNSDRPNSYAPEAATEAWKEIDAFLSRNLKSSGG